MDHERYAERLITEALARGELDPSVGAGRPLPDVASDPDWWVRALIERERFPQRHADAVAGWSDLVTSAVDASDLATARTLLEQANGHAEAWNAAAAPEFALPITSELRLLAARVRRPVE